MWKNFISVSSWTIWTVVIFFFLDYIFYCTNATSAFSDQSGIRRGRGRSVNRRWSARPRPHFVVSTTRGEYARYMYLYILNIFTNILLHLYRQENFLSGGKNEKTKQHSKSGKLFFIGFWGTLNNFDFQHTQFPHYLANLNFLYLRTLFAVFGCN